MSDLTYRQLDEALRELDFSVRQVDNDTNVYKHARSGAVLVLPARPAQRVIPHHLVATRATLDAFGIPTPPELAAQLQAS